MTNEEFRSYLDRGLGQAVLLLQKEENPGAFEQTLRQWLFAGGSENGISAEYKKDLIDCLPDPEAFVRQLSRDAVDAVKQGKNACVEDVLRLYGGEMDLHRALEEEYARSFGGMREYAQRGDPSEAYLPCARSFSLTQLSLVRLTADEEKTERMLLDLADLYAINEEIIPALPLVPHLMSILGWKKTRAILERLRDRHPFGQHLWEQTFFPENVPAPEWLRPPLTVELVQRYADTSGEMTVRCLETLRQYMRQAPHELLCEIARLGMEETDLRRRNRLLLLFIGYDTVLDPPPFPLSPDWLIGQVETVLADPKGRPERDEVNAAQTCLRLLCRVRHPLVREYADTLLRRFCVPAEEDLRANLREQMRGGVPDRMLRRCALQMRWHANYEKADRDALAQILREPGTFDYDVCAALFIRAFSFAVPELPVEMISSVYENVCSPDRYELVQALRDRGMLTEEMRRESAHDAWKPLRDLMEEKDDGNDDGNDEG